MKAGVIAYCAALKALFSLGYAPAAEVHLQAVVEEVRGRAELRRVVPGIGEPGVRLRHELDAFAVRGDDLAGAVGRPVVDHHDPTTRVVVLSERAVDRLPEKALVVVVDDEDGRLGRHRVPHRW